MYDIFFLFRVVHSNPYDFRYTYHNLSQERPYSLIGTLIYPLLTRRGLLGWLYFLFQTVRIDYWLFSGVTTLVGYFLVYSNVTTLLLCRRLVLQCRSRTFRNPKMRFNGHFRNVPKLPSVLC